MKDNRFASVEYMIEADDFAKLKLWEEWHDAIEWEQDLSARHEEVGHLSGHPVSVLVSFATINGHGVAFYWSHGRVVDWEMVDRWMKQQCPPNTPHCDAMNFHCALRVIDPESAQDTDLDEPSESKEGTAKDSGELIASSVRVGSEGRLQIRRHDIYPNRVTVTYSLSSDGDTHIARWSASGVTLLCTATTKGKVIEAMKESILKYCKESGIGCLEEIEVSL